VAERQVDKEDRDGNDQEFHLSPKPFINSSSFVYQVSLNATPYGARPARL
jgi:hypothetical protein